MSVSAAKARNTEQMKNVEKTRLPVQFLTSLWCGATTMKLSLGNPVQVGKVDYVN